MVLTQNIAQSTKRIGKYEERIILRLTRYFQDNGYEAIPHSRLNIAWGSILSDVDLLLLKDHVLTYVEVKSSRDNIMRAKRQTERVMDYVDYAYVATDRKVRNWAVPNVGLIHVQEEAVTLVRRAKKFSKKPRFCSIIALKKKCLTRFFGNDSHWLMVINKHELAQHVYAAKGTKCTRECLKEIVTCGESCDTYCPITQTENVTNL
jgi:Holliday junction resolvase-like predicted endonuclease